MALELAKHNAVYEDIASKFFEVCSHLSCDSNPSIISPLQKSVPLGRFCSISSLLLMQ